MAIMQTVNSNQKSIKFEKQFNVNGIRVSLSMGSEGHLLDLTNLDKYRVNSMATFLTSGLALRVSLILEF